MKFPCPQCGLSRQFVIEGTAKKIAGQRCLRCASKITIKKVSARRKDFREQTVFCSACGSDFLFSSECPFCKAPFTGYSLVCTERPRKACGVPARNLTKAVERLGSRWVLFASTRIRCAPIKIWVASALFALVLTLLVTGTSYYNHRQDEQNYLRNYVLTLYGIKSGFDRGNIIGNNLVIESRRYDITGYYPTGTVSEELEELKTVQAEVDQLMEHLTSPPESLRDAGARLQQLYSVYMRQNSLVTTPSGSVDNFESELQEIQKDFLLTLSQFKASLPSQLWKEVKKSGTRYNLQFLK